MKLCPRHLTTSLTLIVILLAGVGGCAQYTPVFIPSMNDGKPTQQAVDNDTGVDKNTHKGDGLSVFEEYRGLMIGGIHKRLTDVSIEDIAAMKQSTNLNKKEKNDETSD